VEVADGVAGLHRGDDLLRGDRQGSEDAQGKEVGCASGCVILILDAAVKAASIIFWYVVLTCVGFDALVRNIKNMWR
jgi:hypothetical protein